MVSYRDTCFSFRRVSRIQKRTRTARGTDLEHGSDEGPPRADVDRMHELKVVDHKGLAIKGCRIENARKEKKEIAKLVQRRKR